MKNEFTNFEIALQRFQLFLAGQGWPSNIIWVASASIEMKSPKTAELNPHFQYNQEKAKQDYDFAVYRGLGVAIEGLASTNEETYAAVTWPKDEAESESLMFCENSLKMSIKTPRIHLTKQSN
jgi:hypothetical protein